MVTIKEITTKPTCKNHFLYWIAKLNLFRILKKKSFTYFIIGSKSAKILVAKNDIGYFESMGYAKYNPFVLPILYSHSVSKPLSSLNVRRIVPVGVIITGSLNID